ncbi:calcineurin-like phosphoesterase [Enterococcus phage iF6]|uniref:Calcineurin-like phosphoesterase n=1 Tax=Enterococcus phage iF6 TaxID=2765371 RepID=A0A7G8ZYW1_9CAUD|nr:calcineurin-like phosphoesterase [Enterococcus phage iF6]
MSKIWFTSDTHFGQERTFKYSMRGMYFDNVEHADLAMIERWNDVVDEEDTVYHLGDFGNFEVAKQLKGKIHLLFGNYERDGKGGFITPEQENYFEFVRKGTAVTLVDQRLVLVHEPSHMSYSEDKIKDGYFGLFGHIHEKQKVKRNALNVGVDVHNFTPVSLETVEFYRNAIQNVYNAECFDNFELGGLLE